MVASAQVAVPIEIEDKPDLPRAQLWLADRISSSLPGKLKLEQTPNVTKLIYQHIKQAWEHNKIDVPEDQRVDFVNGVLDEVIGLGPIEQFMRDETVTEVMVNGPNLIYVEKNGKLIETTTAFVDDDHVQRTINKIVEPLGRHIDAASPMVDARLPDGSRVHAAVPPCAVDGPTITIRRFTKERLTIEDLVNFGSLTAEIADYLQACVVSKLNILVSGGTGSGKTTLLNALSGYIPESERIITIEDAAELRLNQRHVVRLETKHPSHAGDSEVTIRELVINSLRMRPERIVVGECRGGEALDMLQAMNTGHDGSLTTIHANSPRDALSRLETLTLMAGIELPIQVVRNQMASAVNLIVQQTRLRDGSRKVTQITEIAGMEGNTIVMQDVFKFEDLGESEGNVVGEFRPCGLRPYYNDRLKIHGFNLPASLFMKPMNSKNGKNGKR